MQHPPERQLPISLALGGQHTPVYPLTKELSANVFNAYWNNNIRPDINVSEEPKTKISRPNNAEDLPAEEPHQLFDCINTDKSEGGLIEALGGLFVPEAQGEDYEERDFANRMKKNKKKRRRKK